MLTTAFLLAFFNLLCCSEYTSPRRNTFSPDTSLLRSYISIRNNIIYLCIKASKTDPFWKGYTIRIGTTNSATLCPVSFMRRLLDDHAQPSGPLFTFHNGTYLTRAYLSDLLQLCYPELNLNTHSFRIGGAFTAASIGRPDSAILLLGRWSSDAYLRYIRLPDDVVSGLTAQLAGSSSIQNTWYPLNDV